jgi:predicted GNAT family N-acyltransferase
MLIRRISWEQTIPIRHHVLWPNKLPEFCHVEGDQEAMHFGAFINEQLVSVASVYLVSDKARLRKFATKTEYQHQGVGSKMLTTILQSLIMTDIEVFWCDARASAIEFYRRFGLEPYGDLFYKDGVAYCKMQVSLK